MSAYDCVCDYDPPEFATVRNIKAARKQQRCTECGCIIQPGEPYHCITGKWEGWMNTFKHCQRCRELIAFVQASIPCFCWAYDNVFEDARECAREYGHEAPGLRFGVARRIYKIQEHAAATRGLP